MIFYIADYIDVEQISLRCSGSWFVQISRESYVDESMINSEPIPKVKKDGVYRLTVKDYLGILTT